MSLKLLSILSLFLPVAFTSPILARDASPLGLHFAPNATCTPDQTTAVLNAITDARTLANAALGALKAPSSQNPAAYFFPSSVYPTATSVFNSVGWAILPLNMLPTSADQPWLNTINLYCQDLDNLCDTPSPGNTPGSSTTRWGYVPESANPAPGFGTAEIVVCPAMLALPRTQAPCTGTPGLANLGWAFLRTFVQLRSVQTVCVS